MTQAVNKRTMAMVGALLVACVLIFGAMASFNAKPAHAACTGVNSFSQVENWTSSFATNVFPVGMSAGTANSGTGSMKYTYAADFRDYAMKVLNFPCPATSMKLMTRVDPAASDSTETIIIGVDFDNDDPVGVSDCSYHVFADSAQNESALNGFHKYSALGSAGTECVWPLRTGTHQFYIRDEDTGTATHEDFLQLTF